MLVITATETMINDSIKAKQRTWKKDVRMAKNIHKCSTVSINNTRKMSIKTACDNTLFTGRAQEQTKRTTSWSVGENAEKLKLICFCWEGNLAQPLQKKGLIPSIHWNVQLPNDSAIPLLGFNQEKSKHMYI